MAELGIAVVGSGYWGVNYIRLVSNLPHLRLAGICDANEARLNEIAARFPNVYTCTDLDCIAQAEDIHYEPLT